MASWRANRLAAAARHAGRPRGRDSPTRSTGLPRDRRPGAASDGTTAHADAGGRRRRARRARLSLLAGRVPAAAHVLRRPRRRGLAPRGAGHRLADGRARRAAAARCATTTGSPACSSTIRPATRSSRATTARARFSLRTRRHALCAIHTLALRDRPPGRVGEARRLPALAVAPRRRARTGPPHRAGDGAGDRLRRAAARAARPAVGARGVRGGDRRAVPRRTSSSCRRGGARHVRDGGVRTSSSRISVMSSIAKRTPSRPRPLSFTPPYGM